ncbi:MAG: SDR family oxidoreductase [Candidatus Binatia bacterium]|nr:SDR family oxidoreductase [Candidatus Binatia bacterium]
MILQDGRLLAEADWNGADASVSLGIASMPKCVVAKAGVIQLARQIAVNYASQGIRTNAIQPAGIQDNNLSPHVGEDREHQTTPLAKLPRPKPSLPIRRQGHARDEYGAPVAFLLLEDAGYITGASLPVDDGYLAT